MAVNKNGIVVMGAVFVDIKGFPDDVYIPDGRNAGKVEYIHGGVSRNVVEDIANMELRPTFLSIVDESALGDAVVRKLNNHKVNTEYIQSAPNGMGTWLAVFDNNGDLAGSISQRPDLMPLLDVLEKKGDEIFANADSIIIEVDVDKEIVKKVVELCEKHQRKLYGVVSNMSIAVERRDFLQKFDCFICNQLEAGMFFATGAGDAFCAGVSSGLTYGKTLAESVEIGTRLAASVITSSENVCPRFLPGELGIEA